MILDHIESFHNGLIGFATYWIIPHLDEWFHDKARRDRTNYVISKHGELL